jgi:Tol biopolymer transport system component/DNA-binding winged helix-turn-helix (wHTH) protein
MVKSETRLFKFGKFQIDSIKRVLLRDNIPVQLPPRAFDVLLALVEHNQYVIEKDELMRLVWGERIVEENNLTRHVSTLRRVLEESPNDHRYIVTVPGRGYSFVAEVERLPSNGLPSPSNGDVSALDGESGDGARPGAVEFVNRVAPVRRSEAAIKTEPLGLKKTIAATKTWLWTAVVLILVIGVAIGLSLLGRPSRINTLNSYRDWDILRLSRNGSSFLPDISRDGKYVAYVNRESGQYSVWLLQLETTTNQQIVPPEKFGYFDLLFCPKGNELYFTRREGSGPQRTLYRMPMIGGVAKKLRDDIDSSIAVSPDGTRVAFARRNSEGKSEFIIADSYGVEERVLATQRIQVAAWSPDGNVIAYSVGDAGAGGDNMSLYEVRLDDGSRKEICERRWNYVGKKTWLPDGSGLILSAREKKSNVSQLWFVAYPSGDAHPLSNNLDHFHSASITQDAGTLVAEQVAAVSDIWSGPLTDMASARKIGAWGMSGLGLLSDGRIAYTAVQSGDTGKIWLMSPDGTERRQLSADSGHDISAVASPDGRYVVFASNRSGNFEIWRIDIDGSNLTRLTTSKGSNSPSISPDGRWVVYLSTDDHSLYRVPIEGGEPMRVAGEAVGVSAVSPDGKSIAYFSQGKQSWGIDVSSFESGSLIKRFEIGSHSLSNTSLKWTPDGAALLYTDSPGGVGNIWMQRLAGSPPKQLTNFKADGLFRFDVSGDGRNLVCARGGWKHDIVLIRNLRRRTLW